MVFIGILILSARRQRAFISPSRNEVHQDFIRLVWAVFMLEWSVNPNIQTI